MTEPEDVDEDLFADLYERDDEVTASAPASVPISKDTGPKSPAIVHSSQPVKLNSNDTPVDNYDGSSNQIQVSDVNTLSNAPADDHQDAPMATFAPVDSPSFITTEHGFTGTVGIKEDGKMFIGGLNWETTDQSLREYFEQYGEVTECTVMRDGATGRSRGFGFLTFKDPKTVNVVMVKEHWLDGKIIDPKRAIPRDEQEKTSKIFVGGVSQDATEKDFENFFARFGRVIDATLMMDKDTGRPRGFGFVTFEGEAAVEATLAQPLEILGKPIEVKRAQPRGNLREEEEQKNKFGRRGQQNDKFGRGGQDNQSNNGGNQQDQNQQGQGQNNMSPAMMAQYWQRLQQYFQVMQQTVAQNMNQNQGAMGNGMGNGMGMGGMNPAMMQQMMGMQPMQNRGQDGSPGPQGPNMQNMGNMGNMGNMANMGPAMMQQMQQMQMQQQMQQGQSQGQGGDFQQMMSPSMSGMGSRPAYNAQEQLAFEQRKYEQQQQQGQGPQGQQGRRGNFGGSPGPWDGIYEESPQPNQGGGGNRGGRGSQRGHQSAGGTPQPTAQPPANAPTGPKNAGRPGANYRGGGRGNHRGFHPYSRN